jgi:ADP-heptose:LPS heptosyltransferase
MIKRMLKTLEHIVRRSLNVSKIEFQGTLIKTISDSIPLQSDSKILILRIDKFGDMIITLPIIREIRRRYPNATIDIVLGKSNISLASKAKNYANSVLYYDKTLFGLFRLIHSIRKTKYDICIDPLDNPSVTSGNLCYMSNARFTVGLYKSNASKYSHCIAPKDRLTTHIVERTAQVLLAFGIDPESCLLDCEFPIEQSFIEKALSKLESKIDVRRPVIAINTTGSVESRTMNEKFAIDLYKEIFETVCSIDGQILLFGPESQRELLLSVQKQTGCILAPYTKSFNEFAAMLKCASIIISPDTSAVHLAASWKTPTICLFCKDNTGTALWTPYKTMHESVISDTYSINDIDTAKISIILKNIINTHSLNSAKDVLMS